MDHLLSNKEYLSQYRTPQKIVNDKGLVTQEVSGETIASYLNKRLYEIGVRRVFAIPGDYIAEWVESLDDPGSNPNGLIREHPNNEMCATYAADGYGRANSKSVGCVSFTYGVGALNAVQAVAGAYVESVPLIAINGSPSIGQFNSKRDEGILWHHMFDGSYTDLRIFENVTAMALRIDNPTTGPDLIDAALRTCITLSRPVYIEIATQTALLSCRPLPQEPLIAVPVPQDAVSLEDSVNAVMKHLQSSKRLILLGGVEIARYGLQDSFAELCQLLQAPYLSTLLGKSTLSEYRDDIQFSGVYNGRNSQDNVQQLISASDVILSLGAYDTDFNFSGLANGTTGDFALPEKTIEARRGSVKVEGNSSQYWGAVRLGPFIDALIKRLKTKELPNAPFPVLKGSPWMIPKPDSYQLNSQITWDSFKSYLSNNFLSKDDIVLADTGLTFYSLQNLKVDQDCYIAQLSWGAIGYSVAANYGAKLANNDYNFSDRRAITISGDGAFAESVNAIGTIAQMGLNSVIFVMDNRVFAIEQWLIDADAFAEDAPPPEFKKLTVIPQGSIWDYVKIAEGFGGKGYLVKTNEQLAKVLDQLKANKDDNTFSLVAVNIVKKDLPSNVKWKLNT